MVTDSKSPVPRAKSMRSTSHPFSITAPGFCVEFHKPGTLWHCSVCKFTFSPVHQDLRDLSLRLFVHGCCSESVNLQCERHWSAVGWGCSFFLSEKLLVGIGKEEVIVLDKC